MDDPPAGAGTMASPVRVLFIAGMGRSGSTVLERFLGACGDVVAAGELRYLWTLGFIENQYCGCGMRIQSCPFWSDVVGRAFGGFVGVDAAAMARAQERLIRLGRVPALLRDGPPRRDLAAFAGNRERLFRAIAAVSGARVVVDSSKYPPYGLALRRAPGLDVRTVHLVRDSRGVAGSLARTQRDPAIEGRRAYRYRRGATLASLNWLALNLLAEATFRGRDAIRVGYEAFARDPLRQARRILTLLDLPAIFPPEGPPGSFDLGVSHTIAGNPMRLQQGAIPIRPDDGWKAELPLHSRMTVAALTWPLLLHYRGHR